LNYTVVDLVENYNFHVKFTSIRVQTEKLQSTVRVRNAVGHGGRSLPSSPMTLDL
jgi:hypothetical protein